MSVDPRADDDAPSTPEPLIDTGTPAAQERPRDLPRVPEDVGEDVPPDGEESLVSEKDPAAEHRRGMDLRKLTFATRLIGFCVIVAVALSCVQFFFQKTLDDTASLNNSIDLLKLLATTALGFVFGRHLDSNDG